MQWYNGNISEAVSLSRQKGSIFVVYIEGTDSKSNEITTVVNTSEVSQLLMSDSFVAIHIEAGSLSHKQFSEIYKPSSIPSIYFIGKSGAPLEILTDPVNQSQMVEKIQEIIVKNGGSPSKTDSNFIKSESSHSSGSQATQPPIEERLKIAQELIEKKRLEKKAEEERKEREKEIERRKLGQDVQKMKKWQQEQDLKNFMDDRQREKREQQEARDRVKRQIEEDKREKAARMNQFIPSAQPKAPAESAKSNSRPSDSNSARLQFRLPDGSSQTSDFASSATLLDVINYVKTNLKLSQFKLSTTFPRREFVESDSKHTLLELELVPNAVILVLPSSKGTVSTTDGAGNFVSIFWFILAPVINIFTYVKSLIFGGPPAPVPSPEPQSREPVRSDPKSSPASTSGLKHRISGQSSIRRSGNIHRLTDRDSDDDNNTWNGNSTQQM